MCSSDLPSLPSSSSSSVLGSENSDTVLSSTHMLPMCSEQVSSVPDNSEASVSEFLASEASSDTSSEDSLCFDDDGDVQRNIQQIIHQHTDEVIKKWGNSEQWVLELRNGKRVAVPIQISLPSREDIGGVKDSNPLAIVPGRATESKEFNDELDKGMDVFVEDWSSDFNPEKASQDTDSSTPLMIDPLAFSLPSDATDISDQPAPWLMTLFWVRAVTRNGLRTNSVAFMISLGLPLKV